MTTKRPLPFLVKYTGLQNNQQYQTSLSLPNLSNQFESVVITDMTPGGKSNCAGDNSRARHSDLPRTVSERFRKST